jgi:hypothetical protein
MRRKADRRSDLPSLTGADWTISTSSASFRRPTLAGGGGLEAPGGVLLCRRLTLVGWGGQPPRGRGDRKPLAGRRPGPGDEYRSERW